MYNLQKVKEKKELLEVVVVVDIHEEEIRRGGILVEGIHVQAGQHHQDLFFLLLLFLLDLDPRVRTFYQEKDQLMNRCPLCALAE